MPNRGGKWRPAAPRWPLMRQRRASGASASIVAAYAAALSIATPSIAKTPGEVHCYNGICHRVKSAEEMRLIVGSEREEITSFYDTAMRDSMNAGTITSSGEEFDAESDSHAASSLYPDGTELLIWNPKNRKTAHIRVNDFGPFYMLRTIDVTRGVAEKLEFSKTGVAKLRVVVIWAPNQDEARFRRRRVYPAVDGYMGRVDHDQLTVLKNRLIAMAPLRNGRQTTIAARQPVQPAAVTGLTSAGSDAKRTTAKTASVNTVQITLGTRGPLVTLTAVPAIAPRRIARVDSAASPQALAAATLPVSATITARDAGIAIAVASLEAAASSSAAPEPAPRPAVHENPASAHAWTPNTQLWQQLLIALGILSVATVGWRTRTPSAKRAHPGAGSVENDQPPSKSARQAGFPAAPASIDNLIALPQLPRRPVTKTMDEWRAQAVDHMERYEFALAEVAYRQLLAAREAAFGSQDPKTASAERQLADCLREQGRYASAEPHYRRALANMALAAGAQHPATGDILDEFAVSLSKQGRGAQAEQIARQALTIRRAAGLLSREHATTCSILAETLRTQGKLSAAEAEHRLAWSQFIALSGHDSVESAASMTSIGTVIGELGQFGAAEELLNAGTRILSSACGPDHPATASRYAMLGNLYRLAGALDPARTMLMHALDIRERKVGERHPETVENVLALALIATEQQRVAEARAYLDRALAVLMGGERNHLGPHSPIRGLLGALSHHHDTSLPLPLAAE